MAGGGYAAHQSLVVDQGVYKAAVAVAPVTDLAAMVGDVAGSTGWVTMRFVTYVGLDHHLDDSAKRAELLRESDLFFKAAFTP